MVFHVQKNTWSKYTQLFDLPFLFIYIYIFITTVDSNDLINGQEDNQQRLRNSNSAASLQSNTTTSENNYSNDGIEFLPGMKNCCFTIPRFLPPCEWIRSQCKIILLNLYSNYLIFYQCLRLFICYHHLWI